MDNVDPTLAVGEILERHIRVLEQRGDLRHLDRSYQGIDVGDFFFVYKVGLLSVP